MNHFFGLCAAGREQRRLAVGTDAVGLTGWYSHVLFAVCQLTILFSCTLCRLLHQRAIPVDVFRLCLILCCRMFSLWVTRCWLNLFFCGLLSGSGAWAHRAWQLAVARGPPDHQDTVCGGLGSTSVWLSWLCLGLRRALSPLSRAGPGGPSNTCPHTEDILKSRYTSHHHHKKAVFAAWKHRIHSRRHNLHLLLITCQHSGSLKVHAH